MGTLQLLAKGSLRAYFVGGIQAPRLLRQLSCWPFHIFCVHIDSLATPKHAWNHGSTAYDIARLIGGASSPVGLSRSV